MHFLQSTTKKPLELRSCFSSCYLWVDLTYDALGVKCAGDGGGPSSTSSWSGHPNPQNEQVLVSSIPRFGVMPPLTYRRAHRELCVRIFTHRRRGRRVSRAPVSCFATPPLPSSCYSNHIANLPSPPLPCSSVVSPSSEAPPSAKLPLRRRGGACCTHLRDDASVRMHGRRRLFVSRVPPLGARSLPGARSLCHCATRGAIRPCAVPSSLRALPCRQGRSPAPFPDLFFPGAAPAAPPRRMAPPESTTEAC